MTPSLLRKKFFRTVRMGVWMASSSKAERFCGTNKRLNIPTKELPSFLAVESFFAIGFSSFFY